MASNRAPCGQHGSACCKPDEPYREALTGFSPTGPRIALSVNACLKKLRHRKPSIMGDPFTAKFFRVALRVDAEFEIVTVPNDHAILEENYLV